MDVYEPTGDVLALRPVVLVAFGGSFIAGSRADVADLCRAFARRGYVAIAPDYRVGLFSPNTFSTSLAVMRGAHDMKACVRYLRRTILEEGNPYRIDQDRIIIGGVSAGAISALHAGFLDDESELPAVLASQGPAYGGVEGVSGNPGYSSDVLCIYSFSGALGDTVWAQSGDLPVCSVHEVGDGVVPYYTQEVSVFGIPTGLVASGSHDIHERLTHLGVDNCLLTYPGSGHVGYLTSDQGTALGFVMDFLADQVCNEATGCGNVWAAVPDAGRMALLGVYPNPTNGSIRVDGLYHRVAIMDPSGRELLRSDTRSNGGMLDLSGLAAGSYFIRSLEAPGISLPVFKVD